MSILGGLTEAVFVGVRTNRVGHCVSMQDASEVLGF